MHLLALTDGAQPEVPTSAKVINMTNQNSNSSPPSSSLINDLDRSSEAVGALIDGVRPDQWLGKTPCVDWTVRGLVDHVIGMNRVFVATLTGQALPPRPAADHVEGDPGAAFRNTAAELLVAFSAPGVLDRVYTGPLGSATGAERLQIHLYDLLAHGWDIARATRQRAELPDGVAERSLAFARTQVHEEARPGRFGEAQPVDDGAPAIGRLVGFLGRPTDATSATHQSDEGVVSERLRRAIVLRVREDSCDVLTDGHLRSVGYARQFPSPRTERVSPGHLVAIATASNGTEVILWRWYDAVVLEERDTLVGLWEPAHGEVSAHPRPAYPSLRPGTRAYLSSGLPGAEWWVTGPVTATPESADVELDEVERLYTEHNLWDDLV